MARRLAEARRLLKRHDAAAEAADVALARARGEPDRSAALLERARLHRDQGKVDSSLAAYDRAESLAEGADREAIAWESAREAEDTGRWAEARVRFERVAALALRRADDAAVRVGLMWLADGAPDSARARWRGVAGEPAEFWRGVVARRLAARARPGARRDSLVREGEAALRAVAARPGYAFYRMAARDTLKLRGWAPDSVAATTATGSPTLALARDLVGLGANAEAQALLSRWNARDPRVVAEGVDLPTADAWLAAAEIAYASGSAPLGTVLADRAARALEDSLPARAWAATPWAYPPAFDRIVAERPDSLSPAQLWAVMRQESRFDPRARSRSDALGLMQLLLPTARDMAKLLRDPVPDTEDLFDPRRNVRYGARYLSRLVKRFDGHWTVALSAYNAGPSTIPEFWRDLVARGGEALFAEIASNADAQDYVRKISANVAAYRELSPSRR
jgi:soluble lytic murein transglycosylase